MTREKGGECLCFKLMYDSRDSF